jgi:hypothetical protein
MKSRPAPQTIAGQAEHTGEHAPASATWQCNREIQHRKKLAIVRHA